MVGVESVLDFLVPYLGNGIPETMAVVIDFEPGKGNDYAKGVLVYPVKDPAYLDNLTLSGTDNDRWF